MMMIDIGELRLTNYKDYLKLKKCEVGFGRQ